LLPCAPVALPACALAHLIQSRIAAATTRRRIAA